MLCGLVGGLFPAGQPLCSTMSRRHHHRSCSGPHCSAWPPSRLYRASFVRGVQDRRAALLLNFDHAIFSSTFSVPAAALHLVEAPFAASSLTLSAEGRSNGNSGNKQMRKESSCLHVGSINPEQKAKLKRRMQRDTVSFSQSDGKWKVDSYILEDTLIALAWQQSC